MTRLVLSLVILLIFIGSTDCSLLTSFDEQKLSEDTFERCRDNIDNDGDTLIDCDDPSCVSFTICNELTAQSCADNLDNDQDGLVDCNDPGCVALAEVCVEKTDQACADEQDNDNDMLTDCLDPDCQEFAFCQEITLADCSDGEDNDQDGLVDCNDFGCYHHVPCCDLPVPPFSGDDFSHYSKCSIHVATTADCTSTSWESCNSFNPAKWISWGLPRARQESGAFVSNDPCGCEASGIVSIESVHLDPGLSLSFTVSLDQVPDETNAICAGLTNTSTFVDDTSQCSGAAQPQLLAGICLESDHGLPPRIVAMVNGTAQASNEVLESEPLRATIRLDSEGIKLIAGPLSHKTTPIDPQLDRALVVVAGRGTTARLSDLSVVDPEPSSSRCRVPTSWYRHLGRGEPVIPAVSPLENIGHPTVIYRPDDGTYLMLFWGQRSPMSWSGIFAATSADGLTWTVSDDPVIPSAPDDDRFGSGQTAPSLLYHSGTYHVWYTREVVVANRVLRTIAHATSGDGRQWKPRPGPGGQPHVLGPGKASSWDSLEVSAPAVIEGPDGALLMVYSGTSVKMGSPWAIGIASSPDGTAWQRLLQQPVLSPDPHSMELSYEDPTLAYDPERSLYMMWFTGQTFGQPASIRHAISVDALSWVQFEAMPVLTAGHIGTFDEGGVRAATVRLSDRIQLWYTGIDSKGVGQVGYAENRGGQ